MNNKGFSEQKTSTNDVCVQHSGCQALKSVDCPKLFGQEKFSSIKKVVCANHLCVHCKCFKWTKLLLHLRQFCKYYRMCKKKTEKYIERASFIPNGSRSFQQQLQFYFKKIKFITENPFVISIRFKNSICKLNLSSLLFESIGCKDDELYWNVYTFHFISFVQHRDTQIIGRCVWWHWYCKFHRIRNWAQVTVKNRHRKADKAWLHCVIHDESNENVIISVFIFVFYEGPDDEDYNESSSFLCSNIMKALIKEYLWHTQLKAFKLISILNVVQIMLFLVMLLTIDCLDIWKQRKHHTWNIIHSNTWINLAQSGAIHFERIQFWADTDGICSEFSICVCVRERVFCM